MRKKYWIMIALLAAVGVGVFWYWYRTPNDVKIDPENNNRNVASRPGGVIEEAEEIEPIVVDRGIGTQPEPASDPGPMPVVRWEPGMKQPARPDAELAPQMPFADEHDLLGLRRNPVAAILDPVLARLNIFDGIEEEQEMPQKSTDSSKPRPSDYHHDQCPHRVGSPTPHFQPVAPRD